MKCILQLWIYKRSRITGLLYENDRGVGLDASLLNRLSVRFNGSTVISETRCSSKVDCKKNIITFNAFHILIILNIV